MNRHCRTRHVALLAALAAGLTLCTARPVAAQWGGGWGFGGGYGGPFGGMGMTLQDQEMWKMQMYQENAARYNVMNAQTMQNYASANLMQQQAMNTALQNQMMAQQIAKDKYNLYSQAKNEAIAAARASAPTIPLSSLIDSGGQVRWPSVAPSGAVHAERRDATDAAVKTAYVEFATVGRSSTAPTMEAKRLLFAYGQPALDLLRVRKDTRGHAQLLEFLRALDAALDAMAAPPQPPQSDKAPAEGAKDAAPKSTSGSPR
jgi:hypothetical protein